MIIPVFNVEKYLVECLESALCQSFQSYELICINDASTDKSGELLQEYENQYHNIKVITHSENRGLSAARNTGIKNARGKYIMFLDSDDMIVPNMLAELYCVAEKNCVDIVYFNMHQIDREEYKKKVNKAATFCDDNVVYSGKEFFCLMAENNQIRAEACRQFIRKDFLQEQKIEFYEGILHEDMLFSFLCAMDARRVIYVNKEYYIYRQRSGSIMSSRDYRRSESLFVVLVQIMAFWVSHTFTERESKAVAQFFEGLYYTYQYYLCLGNSGAELEVGGHPEKTLFALIQMKDEPQYLMLNENQIEEVKKREKVIVYGAGRGAADIVKILQRENIQIDAIAVNDVSTNPKIFCGFPVVSIDDIAHYMKDATVIIGVTEKYSSGILEKLKHLGYNNVILAESKKTFKNNKDRTK